MALTATEIQARLTALYKARDSGALIVRHGDESTQFRSLAEIEKIIASLEGQLAAANGEPRKRVRYVEQPCKGF